MTDFVTARDTGVYEMVRNIWCLVQWCCDITCCTMESRGSLLICACVCVLVIHVTGQVGSICRPNERFLPCGGCQKTCKDPAPQCEGVCKTGCYCNEDEVRNEDGHCVKLSECPQAELSSLQTSEPRTTNVVCPENEEYRFCEACNKTCENPNPMCPAQCARGCFCAGDLVRDSDGRCVRVEECSNLKTTTKPPSALCGPHQIYNSCQKCEDTCRDPYPVCYSGCQAGCFCEEGYLKDPSGQCVKIEDCPKATATCPPNERYMLCGGCLRTCDMPDAGCGHACLPGCYCREGEVRNSTGHCIKLSQCPKVSYELTCGPHQVYNACRSCEMSCSSPTPLCTSTCNAGCFCEEGYVKAPSGQCVKREECPQAAEVSMSFGGAELSVEDCQPDEVYLVCGWCEPSCSEPRPQCPVGVCTRGCLCRPPLLRHHSGHCVEENNCVPQRCSDPNEEYVCRYGCEARCDSRKCFARPRRCALGCHCKLGLLRDVTGRCVTPDNCAPRTIRFHRIKAKTNDSKTTTFFDANKPQINEKSLKTVEDIVTVKNIVQGVNSDKKHEDTTKKSFNDLLSLAREYYKEHEVALKSKDFKDEDNIAKTYKLVTFTHPEKQKHSKQESITFKINGNTSAAVTMAEEGKPNGESIEVQDAPEVYKQVNIDSYVNDILNAVKDILPDPVNFTIINYPL